MSTGSGLEEVERLYHKDLPALGKKRGKVRSMKVLPQYIRFLRGFARLNPKRKLKIAIDCGNGVSGAILPGLLAGLPLQVVKLFWKPDGRFPNHEPNPLKIENLAILRETVRKGSCDLGVAFDGDGDRVAFVDELGEPVPGDLAGALMAQALLQDPVRAGGCVLYDVRATRALPEAIRQAGGDSRETRVGHSHIKANLRQAPKGIMAAELSGHYYFKDFYYSDSAELALFLVLNLLSGASKPASQLVAPLKRYHHTGEINFEVHDIGRTLEAAEKAFGGGGAKVSKTDGLTVDLGAWWFNLRPSNTEPVVRLNLESLRSAEEMQLKFEAVKKVILEA
jgi:phosphomannomutase